MEVKKREEEEEAEREIKYDSAHNAHIRLTLLFTSKKISCSKSTGHPSPFPTMEHYC